MTDPTIEERFEEWWSREGRWIDPDTSDVPWFDKRKELCGSAFIAAFAQSSNYVADDVCEPHAVTFANGRTVKINPDGRFLEIERLRESR
jgi:hypothetical protein